MRLGNVYFGKVTLILTLLSVGFSFFHHLGYDHDHAVLFLVSPPSWIIPFFTDIQSFNRFALYFLTVLTWFFIGLAIDQLIATRQKSK